MSRYGFNFQWMFTPDRQPKPEAPDEKALDFMAKHGFNFVRLPLNYWFWTTDFDYYHPDDKVWQLIDAYVAACLSRDFHISLNLHRAPGYCINGAELEKHNLWQDIEAQDAFVWTWERFAERYQHLPAAAVSFDLINEPPNIGQYGMTRAVHAEIITRTVEAIRAIDADREIVIDGLEGGHTSVPELVHLGVIHSGRGYQPMPVSHYGATWWPDYADAPQPKYPGLEWQGITWDKQALRDFYQPWRDVEAQGAQVHIGEFGCYTQTPNDIALRWLKDLLSLYKEFGWGYSLWEFKGVFGIVEHGRDGALYEHMDGYRIDVEMLSILKSGHR